MCYNSRFVMMAINEVGTAENAVVLQDWVGENGRIVPVYFFLTGSFTFIFGVCFVLQSFLVQVSGIATLFTALY